jgi:hypothetical protein
MSATVEQRKAETPLVRTIWHTRSWGEGCYTGKADSSWGLIFLKHNGSTHASLIGPSTRASSIPYRAGMEYLGICFELGVFMPHHLVADIVDTTTALRNATQHSFWLDDVDCPFPDYQNVEAFVEKLVRHKLLVHDSVVEQALAGEEQPRTQRTIQRHFLRTTGLPHGTIRQIERARSAADLLERGMPILDVVHTTGYTDQSHLTNALKRFIGQTPAKLLARKQRTSMSF